MWQIFRFTHLRCETTLREDGMLKLMTKGGDETHKKPDGMSRKRPSPDGATPASGAAARTAKRRTRHQPEAAHKRPPHDQGERTQGKPLRYAPE
jgi:hypothetical protein